MNMESKKTWRLNRRTFLRGAGAALALPALECMGRIAPAAEPRRLAAIYFPFGVSMPPVDSGKTEWSWFPKDEGAGFEFTKALQPLEPLRDDLTILGGLSHPDVRQIDGHDSAATFLTGWDLLKRKLHNVHSMDQIASAHLAVHNCFVSLVLSLISLLRLH